MAIILSLLRLVIKLPGGEASRTRVQGAWGQFKEFAELLTRRGIPLRQKGRVYRSCVQSVMVYASETWAVRVEEEQRM